MSLSISYVLSNIEKDISLHIVVFDTLNWVIILSIYVKVSQKLFWILPL